MSAAKRLSGVLLLDYRFGKHISWLSENLHGATWRQLAANVYSHLLKSIQIQIVFFTNHDRGIHVLAIPSFKIYLHYIKDDMIYILYVTYLVVNSTNNRRKLNSERLPHAIFWSINTFKGQQRFWARFFKLAQTVSHGATSPQFTHKCAHTLDRNNLIDNEKLLGTSNVGECAVPIPLPALHNIKFAASCRLCLVRRLGMHALARCALVSHFSVIVWWKSPTSSILLDNEVSHSNLHA